MPRTARNYHHSLPVSERGRQWGLYVTGAGFAQARPGRPYPSGGHPASHDFAWNKGRILHEYSIVYIGVGAGQFQSAATGERAVAAGTAILLFPGVWHRFRPLKQTGWEEYWVDFAGEHAERLQERGLLRPEEPLLKTGADELILRGFTTLLDRVRSDPPDFDPLLAASVWEILAAVLSAAKRQQTGTGPNELVRRAKRILEEPREGFPVIAEVAETLGLSPSHLQRLFKDHTGLSPYQYYLQLKIHRAGEMLRGSDLPVKQIARILDFRSVYHLAHDGFRGGGPVGPPNRYNRTIEPGRWSARLSPRFGTRGVARW